MSKPLVIITGASSGIGAATARAFADAGHPLLLLARRVERMAAMDLPNARCVAADVTDRDAVARAVDEAVAAHGPADLLVNNAGIMPLGEIATQDRDEWQRMFDVNCVALLDLTQLVVPSMVERGAGTIVNVSSIAGRNVYGNHMAYCGTKFAVHAMSEQLRRELAPHGVRVVVIAPGMVETELLDLTTSEEIKAGYRAAKEEIGGAIDAGEIANAIAYAYAVPASVCVREVVIAPTRQAS